MGSLTELQAEKPIIFATLWTTAVSVMTKMRGTELNNEEKKPVQVTLTSL